MANGKALNSGMRKILVTGAGGQLGSRLAELAGSDRAMIFALDRSELDITDPQSIARSLDRHQPHAVINAAAYTAVDRAESEPEVAHLINGDGPGWLAAACASRGIDVVHISTDYVFDGMAQRAYLPSDNPSPQGAYAASKRAGEMRVAEAFAGATNANWWVIRVAWLYDVRGANFMQTMVRLGTSGKSLRVVDDQVGAPTAARPFADALLTLVTLEHPIPSGIWHYGTAGPTTWYGFARAIFSALGMHVELAPCTTAEYPTPAKRPAFSYLDGTAFARAIGIPHVPWEEELKNEIDRMK